MRNPVDVPWPETSRGSACRSGVMICKYDVATAVIAVNLHAWQSGEMAEAAGDGGLVLGRLHNRCDRFVASCALAAAEVDLAIGSERIAVIAVGAGVGGGRVACDQMIDRKLVLDRSQAILQCTMRCAHACPPKPNLWREAYTHV